MTSAALSPAPIAIRKRSRWASGERRFTVLLLLPSLIYLALFIGAPLIRLVQNSFLDDTSGDFVGFANYARALGSDEVRAAFGRTLIYIVGVVAAEFILGITVALLFYWLGNQARVIRTVFLYPLMIAPVVAGIMWRFMLIDNYGIVNQLLANLHIIPSPDAFSWLSDTKHSLIAVMLPDVWLTTSFVALVVFGAVQTVSPEVLDAAKIDGAGTFRVAWYVLLPIIRPVVAAAFVIRGVDASQAFATIALETNGGPDSSSETLSLTIYRAAVRYSEPGYGGAMAVMFMILLVVAAGFAAYLLWRPNGDKR
jgi:multiple sugar transport system permease protein